MSRVSSALLAAAVVLAAAPASAQTLTRIETKPFYGAVVTIEGGVRVFRPLPSTGHMIINPGGRTPLNVSINEYRDYSGASGGAAVVPGGYGYGDDYGYRTRGLYLNPWSRWGRHGRHQHDGHNGHHGHNGHSHHGSASRYVTRVGGHPGHAGHGGGKAGGGKGGGGRAGGGGKGGGH